MFSDTIDSSGSSDEKPISGYRRAGHRHVVVRELVGMEILKFLPGLYNPGLPILIQAENPAVVSPGRNRVTSPGREAFTLVDKVTAGWVQGA